MTPAPARSPRYCLLSQDITGAERFSAYSGYAFELRFAGHHDDPAERDANGVLRSCVVAMDAQDYRGRGCQLSDQLAPASLLRDLNKALAAFSIRSSWFDSIATGNWGCGAFKGNPRVKALVQWIVASVTEREIRYYAFTETFGPELQWLSDRLYARHITAGQLLCALEQLRFIPNAGELFVLLDMLLEQ